MMRKSPFVLIGLFLLLVWPTLAQEAESVRISRSAAPQASEFSLQALTLVDAATGSAYTPVRPLYLTHANDGSGRLFVLEKPGQVLVIDGSIYATSTFLDVSNLLSWDAGSAQAERGLLGLAFHPDYVENGLFYIHYSDTNGATVIAEYQVSESDPDQADASSARIVFTTPQPFPNHNGGMIDFGPDGYLYIGLGDGGSQNDPLGTGQNIGEVLGSILRIDVNGAEPYAIPADNPFVNTGSAAPEIWAYGLRNPWRFSFDRATGDLYVADVGQNNIEEINFQPASSPGGENYGWNIFEGSSRVNNRVDLPEAIMPISEYTHRDGCSVTGGYVYRGTEVPALEAAYLYADFCTGLIWATYRDEAMQWQTELILRSGMVITSFGEDEAGELYLINYAGTVYKFAPAS